MLTITDEAARVVRRLTRDADLPEDAGIRIVVDPSHHSLSMGLAPHAESQDIVVTARGAHVFLAPAAAHRLRRRTLQAEVTTSRTLFFLDR
jgi:Fe-S cluster assembly iron-binding protein IscA